MKKIIIYFTLLLVSINITAQEKSIYEKDFLEYWQIVKDNYAYFDSQQTDWGKVKEIYLPKVKKITSRSYFVRLLENCNDELYNGHVSLNTNLRNSNYVMPSGTDIWAEKEGNKFIIESIREGSIAAQIGLKPNMEIVKFNDVEISKGLQHYLPKSFKKYDAKVYNHILNLYLGGTRNSPRKITVLEKGKTRDFVIDKKKYKAKYYNESLVTSRRLKGNIGYIKFNNSLGSLNTVKEFDKALDNLLDTKGMILDLRETASGGNNTVIKGVMGRFITEKKPYQVYKFVSDENQSGIEHEWIELVIPRKETYKKPLVIWVSRWTGSAGEATAIGFDGMKRATIIGTKMAGLLGAIRGFRLKETNINIQIPVTKLFHINGLQRENFVPKIIVKNNSDYLKMAKKVLRF